LEIKLPYGGEKIVTSEIPDENVYYIADRSGAPALRELAKRIEEGLKKPIGVSPLSRIVNRNDKAVILVDDITRPTPQRSILPALLNGLNEARVPDENIEIIIALGTHRAMSQAEMEDRYGKEVIERVHITNHDYKDEKDLVKMGRTELGTPISINRRVREADFVVGVGNIVPHCYAGWAGGGKIVQPGVCGEETTEMTHLLAAELMRNGWLAGRLEGNKVRREIDAVALNAGLKLIVNTVLNREDKVSHLAIGDPIEAFKEGVETAEKMYCPNVPGYADIVMVSSYPADIDYWQAEKALSYAMMGVKQDGSVIFVTPCPERISPIHGELFEERARLSYEENLKAIRNGEVDDVIGGAGVLIHARLMERAEVICYSDGLREAHKEALGFKHASTFEEALEMALKSQGEKAKIGVLTCGDITPLIEMR